VLNDQEEFPILKDGDFEFCEDPSQSRGSPSISYFPATKQYLLTFVCRSVGDPAYGANQPDAVAGAAWFYATSSDLSDPNQWSQRPPQEIVGTWNAFRSADGLTSNTDFYNGWYPTFMSPGQRPGWLATSGYAFYLWGCEGGGCAGRQFTSRRFTIQTSDGDRVAPRAPRLLHRAR
jgi:hypothetical protein